MASKDDDGDFTQEEIEHIPATPEELAKRLYEEGHESGITISAKGRYAQISVRREDLVWDLLIDEKNLAKLIFQAQDVLRLVATRE